MFERFTERARVCVTFANSEAHGLRHNYIGTEHLLLGILREEEGLAARVLHEFDLTADTVRGDIERIVGRGEEEDAPAEGAQIPLTARLKKALELSLREALSMGHNYIGTEHVLLGLVRVTEGVGYRILLEHDINAEKVRNEVLRMLVGTTPKLPGFWVWSEAVCAQFIRAGNIDAAAQAFRERASVAEGFIYAADEVVRFLVSTNVDRS